MKKKILSLLDALSGEKKAFHEALKLKGENKTLLTIPDIWYNKRLKKEPR
jgi:hypothetical protein